MIIKKNIRKIKAILVSRSSKELMSNFKHGGCTISMSFWHTMALFMQFLSSLFIWHFKIIKSSLKIPRCLNIYMLKNDVVMTSLMVVWFLLWIEKIKMKKCVLPSSLSSKSTRGKTSSSNTAHIFYWAPSWRYVVVLRSTVKERVKSFASKSSIMRSLRLHKNVS